MHWLKKIDFRIWSLLGSALFFLAAWGINTDNNLKIARADIIRGEISCKERAQSINDRIKNMDKKLEKIITLLLSKK